LFIYETILPDNKNKNVDNSIIVYNFQNLYSQQRFFIFVNNNSNSKFKNKIKLNSITNLFLNANWLEREAYELSGVFFYGKKDLRNLMLQYGDNSSPFKKTSPCVGLRELFYDSTTDLLIQTPVTIQF
jgi:NADH:ubiquinone oxidoreductase subunit C